MIPYKNNNGNSNVEAYEIGDTYITVKFYKTNRLYTYSYRNAGAFHVDRMKLLAEKGDGLNSYIIHNVRNLYDK